MGKAQIARALGVAAALLGLLAGLPARADTVEIRAWPHKEFGRIVFDWPAAVAFTTARLDDQLTVKFARPIAADLAPIGQNLGGYVRSAALDPDGATVRLTLRRAFETRVFVSETDNIVIDLLAAGPPAARPSAVKPAPAARSPAVLGIRTGAHPAYGRIVFDWTVPVGYVVTRSDDGIAIAFDRLAAVDDVALARNLPAPVTGVVAEATERGLRMVFRAPRQATYRHFRDGTKVALDILPPALKPAARASPRPAPATEARPAPQPVDESALQPAEPPPPQPQKNRLDRPSFGPAGAVVTVDVERLGDGLDIAFNWREAVRAAVWRRGDDVWIAFDRPARIVLSGLRFTGEGLISAVRQYPLEGASMLRLTVRPTLAAAVARAGDVWRLRLLPHDAEVALPAVVPIPVAQRRPPGQPVEVDFRLAGAGGPIWWRDPEIGDLLAVIAAPEPAHGILAPRAFVDFELIRSLHGLAIRVVSDGLRLSVGPRRVVLAGPEGLNLSPPVPGREGAAARVPAAPLGDLAGWRLGPVAEYDDNEAALIRRILKARPDERNAARIALARFYLGHDRAAAAIGVIEVASRQQATTEQRLALKALHGAVSYLLGHYGEAESDLSDRDLKTSADVLPWLAAVSAARGDWSAAHLKFQVAGEVLGRLPDWLADRFYLLAYEAALTVGDLKAAAKRREALAHRRLGERERAYYAFLDGFLLKKQDRPKDALVAWKPLLDSTDRRIRARTELAVAETRLAIGDQTPAQTINTLERLSAAWRGDAFEFDVLKRLAELRFAEKDYREGLSRLRQAASYFSDVKGAGEVAENMRRRFKELFLGGLADTMSPIQALALFQDFRELTPPSREGEEMVRRIAERFVRLDLLDRAAELLQHQVEYRLKGLDKARIGARLAEIRLLDGKPEPALKALDETAIVDAPVELQRRRDRLRARALGALERPDEALATLAEDLSPESDRLRAAIQWRAKRWREAANTLKRTLEARPLRAGDEDTARDVLKWAVALAMIGDDKGLGTLAGRYLERMGKTRYGRAFAAIAGTTAGAAAGYAAVVRATADFDALKSYLDEIKGGAEGAPGSGQAPQG